MFAFKLHLIVFKVVFISRYFKMRQRSADLPLCDEKKYLFCNWKDQSMQRNDRVIITLKKNIK